MDQIETHGDDATVRPRKLTLARETLRNLGPSAMQGAAGGTYYSFECDTTPGNDTLEICLSAIETFLSLTWSLVACNTALQCAPSNFCPPLTIDCMTGACTQIPTPSQGCPPIPPVTAP